jgi:L-ascorbate metabolism protein UlaG (beta-lactamase superfamily)
VYTTDEIPKLDYLIITHDHWDHLDYSTVKSLCVKNVICPLGVGAHLEYWGFAEENIFEMDWNESMPLSSEFTIHCLPTRHFSGRGFRGNKSLWASFLTQTSRIKIYIGGDSGYGKHFREIGYKFGEIDVAILENGQYSTAWRTIHTFPDDVAQAAKELKAKLLLPVHNSKFALSTHQWDDPLNRISEICKRKNILSLTPMTGEKVEMGNVDQKFKKW